MIREGDEGDYYYVIESGRCQVERLVGGVKVVLAELKSGDTFGEEALVSEAKRNATVTMQDGRRAAAPGQAGFQRAAARAAAARASAMRGGRASGCARGAPVARRALPVRVPVRPAARARSTCRSPRCATASPCSTDRQEYIVYCQSGRRSSAAAFLFAQRGYQGLPARRRAVGRRGARGRREVRQIPGKSVENHGHVGRRMATVRANDSRRQRGGCRQ